MYKPAFSRKIDEIFLLSHQNRIFKKTLKPVLKVENEITYFHGLLAIVHLSKFHRIVAAIINRNLVIS